ncbi:MAG TPA: hypothetical protein VH062_33920 [Polyangiaceae bacterium]|jgi:hypothetical protein|nr:hypothetical protein [Polyangiaceae bacterium]
MDRFERLLDGEANDFERALLDAAGDDAPSERARRRTLAAMGVGATVVAGASHAAYAATSAAVASGTVGASKGAATVSAVMLFKWLGTGALVGSLVAATVATVTTPGLVFGKRPAPAVAAAPAVVAVASAEPATHVVAPALVSPPEEAAVAPVRPSVPSNVRVERAVAAPPPVAPEELPVAAVPVAPRAASSNVVAEVAALDRARAALAAGNAREALSRLAEHDAAFPAGILQPEAVVLRVRALVAAGERAQATQVAGRFITAHPDSAQAGRLRAIVGQR